MRLLPSKTQLVQRFDNTRFTIRGGLIALAAVFFIGTQRGFDTWAPRHLDGVAWLFRAIYDGFAIVGLWVVWPAIIAAVLGRSPVAPKEGDPPK